MLVEVPSFGSKGASTVRLHGSVYVPKVLPLEKCWVARNTPIQQAPYQLLVKVVHRGACILLHSSAA